MSQISQSYKFTKILLKCCFYIVYTVYVLIYWFAQTLKSLTSPLVAGLSGPVDT